MTAPTSPVTPGDTELDIAGATEALFEDIARASGNPAIKGLMVSVNTQLSTVRAVEAISIPDLKAEYDNLSDAWQRRDLARLNDLLSAYFNRRRALAAEIATQISRPN